jgi:hypothetical protein
MEVRTGTLTFPSASAIGPHSVTKELLFSAPVRRAVAGLVGTAFGFSQSGGDHHLGLVDALLSTDVLNDVVTVTGTFGVRDWSGEYDDPYEGSIQFIVLAELETGAIPSNLTITGIEYNQAIQFFRSQLDPATAQKDNAIPLIAGKDTVLRVYVDTAANPSRPTIASISGRLEIPSLQSTIPPLNAPIAPLQDASIQRGKANNTLNFLIPGTACNGEIELRVRVFDAVHPDQPGYTSSTFQSTLQFIPVAPLTIHGFGVHYIGKDASGRKTDIPAPGLAALRSTLRFVQKAYPVGEVYITAFDVIDSDGNFNDGSGGGCGSGWNDLLGKLRGMQGDDNDIYFGLIPGGVPSSASGCGGGDGRVAACIVNVNGGTTAAQEIAHAFQRQHAPCGNPPNPDPNFPVFDALPSGSIGEFGIDSNGSVKNPATISDFMSYCGGPTRWVSPYTYVGLLRNFPPQSPFSAEEESRALALQSGDTIPEASSGLDEFLFLDFRLYRNGAIEVAPSFHYPAQPTIKSGAWTPYGIELRDHHNRVLQAQRIWLTDVQQSLDSASLDFFKTVQFPSETSRLVFTCDVEGGCERKEVLTLNVSAEAPGVKITTPKGGQQLSGKVHVVWEGQHSEKPLTYLLRYSNDGGKTWRAVSPRLHVSAYTVDLDLLPGGQHCQFQILATESIRTGRALSEVFTVPPKRRNTTILTPTADTTIVPGQALTLAGESFSPDTGSAHPAEMLWTSDLDGLLGRGQEILVNMLRSGTHTISLRVPDGQGGESNASVRVTVQVPDIEAHTSASAPEHTSKDHEVEQNPKES